MLLQPTAQLSHTVLCSHTLCLLPVLPVRAAAKKFVLQVEYTDGMTLTKFTRQVCPAAAANGITAIYKRQNNDVALDFYRKACPGKL